MWRYRELGWSDILDRRRDDCVELHSDGCGEDCKGVVDPEEPARHALIPVTLEALALGNPHSADRAIVEHADCKCKARADHRLPACGIAKQEHEAVPLQRLGSGLQIDPIRGMLSSDDLGEYRIVNAPGGSIFREEVLRHRMDRLHGTVNIATPLAWQAIGFLLLVIVIASIIFMSFATYARVETVSGTIVLDKGVATIVPSRTGLIQAISVSEGAQVKSGQRLAVIRAEEDMIAGASVSNRIQEALDRQDIQLADQSRLLVEAATADRQRLKAQVDGDLAAIRILESQIADQQQLIAAAEADYSDAKQVAARGYISRRDLEERQATILTRRQQLAQFRQALSDKRAEIAQARQAMTQSAMSAQAQAANAQSSRGIVAQQQAQTDLSRGYALTSPIDGTVTALTARLGQPVTSAQQLMLVVPGNARSRAELYIPTTAAGFLARGQEVRLLIDAFPYQTFGTINSRILSVSRAATPKQTPNGPVPVFIAVASLPEPWMFAYGKQQPLLPGMTLSARIITEKRSLIEWLFDPLFAVRKR